MRTKAHKEIYILSAMLLLSLCLLCGCEKEEPYEYYYYRGMLKEMNSADQGDEYYVIYRDQIGVYSVSEQKVLDIYEMEEEEDVYTSKGVSIAADEDYIFKLGSDGKLWRIDRQTRECVLWTELYHGGDSRSIALKDGYLLYGAHGEIYACPADGDCETDSVLLDGMSEFNGWKVYANNRQCVPAVVDGESNETIYTWDNGVDKVKRGTTAAAEMRGTWLAGGISVYPDYSYLKPAGKERYDIDCLQGEKYEESYLFKNDLTVEGQKVIGRMEVYEKPPGIFVKALPSFTHDILFEIDTETDTSRIIYETKRNSGTRIIGYSDGWIYLVQMREGGMISRETLEGENREELLSLQDTGWDLSDEHRIYFGWQGNHLIIWGMQDGEMRVESLEM